MKKQELGATIEEMNSNMKVVLELVTDMAPKVTKTAEDVEIMKEDIAVLKAGHKIMAQDIKEIKAELKTKADVKDLKALDYRVTRLETKTA